MAEAAERRLKVAKQRLDQFATRPALPAPAQRIHDIEQRLDDTAPVSRGPRRFGSLRPHKNSPRFPPGGTLSPLQVLAPRL